MKFIEFNKIIIYMKKETDKNIKYHLENQEQYFGGRGAILLAHTFM